MTPSAIALVVLAPLTLLLGAATLGAQRRLARLEPGHAQPPTVDAATGVADRSRLEEELAAAWADHLRRDSELALLLVAVDDATHLRPVAAILDQAAKRPRDLVARHGARTLAIVLADTGEAGAARLAAQVLEDVEALGFVGRIPPLRLSLAALRPTATHGPEALLQLAEADLCADVRGVGAGDA